MPTIELIKNLRLGKMDLIQYLNEICDLIESKDPDIKALVSDTFDREQIIQQGRHLLKKYPEPEKRPALFGVPIGVKDIFRVDGFPTRCGSALPASLFEGQEASCVTQLKQAGVIILAKTVTTEFAFFEPGPTRNPHRLEHTPGGSSSGSAAGVASGFFPLALGSQTVGSIIRPAAYCGIVGFKPSAERISKEGVIPFSQTADHVGLFCKDIDSINMCMSLFDTNWNNESPPAEMRFGIPVGPYLDQATDEVLKHFQQHIGGFKNSGQQIIEIPMFDDFQTIHDHHHLMTAAEKARYHAPWFEQYREVYRPRTREWIERGQTIENETLNAYRQEGLALRNKIHDVMVDNDIDAWLCPSTLDTPSKGLDSTGSPAMNLPWTSAGLPAISLPSGFNDQGLPFGLQVVASFNQDERLLSISKRLAKLLSK